MAVVRVRIARERLAEMDALARERVGIGDVTLSAPEVAVLVAAYREWEQAATFAEYDPGVNWPSDAHDGPVDAICAAFDCEREEAAWERAV